MDYVGLAFDPMDEATGEWIAILRRALESEPRWRRQVSYRGLWLFTELDKPAPICPVTGGGGALIGDVFDQSGRTCAPFLLQKCGGQGAPEDFASHLVQTVWGRYVALLQDGDDRPIGVLRDPSGAMECMLLKWGPVWVIGSTLPPNVVKVVKRKVRINWSVVSEQLADPILISDGYALEGVEAVAPGALRLLNAGRSIQTWRPDHFARELKADPAAAKAHLVTLIDRSVAAFSAEQAVIAEISGGLDSSIVASALVHAGARVEGWINLYSDEIGGDERAFAEALSEHLSLILKVVPKPAVQTEPDDLARSQTGLRPSLNALDRPYDDGMAALCTALQAKVLMTGIGGDAVLFQMATPELIQDRVRRLGAAGLNPRAVAGVARWTRRSAWRVISLGLPHKHNRPSAVPPCWMRRHPVKRQHIWLEHAADLPPAKRLHLHAIAGQLANYGSSQRGAAVDLVHPLLAQPILEHCLSVPADLLVDCRRDRALARTAFAGRLPGVILDRRSKGELTAFYARGLAAALPKIRSFLLEGRLVAKDVIHRERLESHLSEAYLAENDGSHAIIRAVVIEAWVRHWEAALT